MFSASGERHCNDETLVAYLDRELPEAERGAVERHLGECWSCRARAAEFEQDIHLVTRVVEAENGGSGEELRRALQTFAKRRAEFEARRESQSLARRLLLSFSLSPVPLVASVVILVGVAVAALWFPGSREPRPEAIVVQATASEQKLRHARPVSHQVLRLEARSPSEPALRDLGTLEIWSEREDGPRYSSRWTDPHHNLRHGVWRSAPTGGYAYDSGADHAVPCSRPAQGRHLADSFQGTSDLASIESAFLGWVRSRAWTLVSFTEEWALFADREGVQVVVERLRNGEKNLWRLSASRVDRGRTFEMDLQVDAETYLPNVQAVRVKADGRVAELRLTVERWHSIPAHELQPAVFTPTVPVTAPQRRADPIIQAPLPFVPDRVPLPEWALTDLELRLRWALHEALECVDVSVRREHDPGIAVRLLVSDSVRQATLERILDGIEGREYIRVAPAGDPVEGPPSHVVMIQKHARLLADLAGRASRLRGLSPQQEAQLASQFADHRRSLRLEMAHLEVQLQGPGHTSREVVNLPVAPHFLGSGEAQAIVSRIYEHAAVLPDVERPDAESVEGLTRALSVLDGGMLSLESSMRWSRLPGLSVLPERAGQAGSPARAPSHR